MKYDVFNVQVHV